MNHPEQLAKNGVIVFNVPTTLPQDPLSSARAVIKEIRDQKPIEVTVKEASIAILEKAA